MNIRIPVVRIVRTLFGCAAVLLLLSLAGQVARLHLGVSGDAPLVHWFNVDHEQNVPTTFSVGLPLVACAILLAIARIEQVRRNPDRMRWIVLGLGFGLLAIDEAWQQHERLTHTARSFLGGGNLGYFQFAWVLPGLVVVITLVAYFWAFLRRLPSPFGWRFFIAGCVYVSGAVGCEMLGGRYASIHGLDNLGYVLLVTAEEGLEMSGVILFIRSLCQYVERQYGSITFLPVDRTGTE